MLFYPTYPLALHEALAMMATSQKPRPPIIQELWDQVTQHLSSLSAVHAACALEYWLRCPRQADHGRVWGSIFKADTWADRASEMDVLPGAGLLTYRRLEGGCDRKRH